MTANKINTYGWMPIKTASGIKLNQKLVDYPGQRHKVYSILNDLFNGMNFISSCQERSVFDPLWKIFTSDMHKRADMVKVDENIRHLLHTTITGLSREYYRRKFIVSEWGSEKLRVSFSAANRKHEQDYKNLMKEV